jgi:hypothetical protein
MDGAVSRMRAPLLTLQARVSATKGDTADALAALRDGLARRGALAERRATLQLMVDATHAVAKVERLLAELAAVSAEEWDADCDALADAGDAPADVPQTPRGSALPLPPRASGEAGGGSGSGGAAAALLERAAAEATRLQLFLSRGGALPFVAALRPRADAASGALGGALRRSLRRALARRDGRGVRDGLASFAALHDAAGAEALVAEALVRPIVLETLAENAAAAAAGGGAADAAAAGGADAPRASASSASAAPAADLAPVFAALRAALERRAGFLLALSAGPDAPRGLCLAANALLCEVDAALAVQRPLAFSPGRPAAFRANHAAARGFLEWLEGAACGDDAAAAALRASPACDAFLRRWNLAAYFSLRFADVAGGLEAALPPPTPGAPLARAPAASASELGFALAPSAAAAAALRRCWAEDVYIPALADKFLTLALQVAARVATWLAAGALRRAAADATAAAAAAAAAAPAAPAQDGSAGGAAGGASGAGGAEAAAPAASAASVCASAALASAATASARNGGGEWAVAAPPDDLAAAAADAAALSSFLTGEPYTALVSAALSHAPADARAQALEALVEAAAALSPPAAALAAAAAAALADRCVEVLRQLRGITATYRMTNKPLPTRHSHFMPAVLAPLRAFLDAGAAAAAPLPPALRERIIAAVAEAVTVRHACMHALLRTRVRIFASFVPRAR